MRYKGTRFYLFIFLLTGLFTSVVVTAYSQSAPYINYSVKDGLPSSEVYHVMQDSKGYMWFSTNRGVSRFNGVTFKSFTPGDGLADPVILESVEDYKGRIWFRSLSGKLSYFYHDSIFRLPVNDTIFSLLKGKIPMSLSIDTSDNVYLSAYNQDGIVIINLRNNYSVSFIPIHCRYTYIAIPPSGQILSGNAAPRATYNRGPDSASLYVFTISNKSTNPVKKLYSHPGIQKALSSVHDNAVHLPGGEIALSYISKLILYNNGSVKYMHDFDYEILKIFPDKTGKLWIILENKVPVYYENGEIVEPLTLKFLKDEGISSVSDDNEGGLWFTTLNHGVYYIGSTDFKVWNTENGLPFDKANFVGVMPGHYIFASSIVNKQVAVILHDTLTCHNVPYETLSSNITGAMLNSDNTVWIGSTLGTIIINNLKSFNVLPSTYFNIANSSMISNPGGTVWVLGKYNLYLVNVINGMFTILKYFPLKMPAAAFCTNNHRGLWLASINGLWEYVNDSLKYYGDKYPGLKHDMKFVRESADGHIWMATPIRE
jgi:ligand-binding sensor domain-containing protein